MPNVSKYLLITMTFTKEEREILNAAIDTINNAVNFACDGKASAADDCDMNEAICALTRLTRPNEFFEFEIHPECI